MYYIYNKLDYESVAVYTFGVTKLKKNISTLISILLSFQKNLPINIYITLIVRFFTNIFKKLCIFYIVLHLKVRRKFDRFVRTEFNSKKTFKPVVLFSMLLRKSTFDIFIETILDIV